METSGTMRFPAWTEKPYAPWLGLAACLVLMLSLLAWKADEPFREYGAGRYQDPEYLLAGENFARDGFSALRGVPFSQIGPLDRAPLGEKYPYLHSQPLAFAANGLLQKMGVRSLAAFRMMGGCLHAFGILCVFLVVYYGTGCHPWAALAAAALTAFSSPLYAHADGVVSYSGTLFFNYAPLALWLHLHANGKGDMRRTWWGVGALFFAQSLYMLITENGFFTLAFVGLYALVFGVPYSRWKLPWLTVPYAAGVAVILGRNVWYMGWGAARELLEMTLYRVGVREFPPDTAKLDPVAANLYPPWNTLTFMWTMVERMSRTFFGFRGVVGLVVFTAIIAVIMYRLAKIPEAERTERERAFMRMLKFGLVLWLAALPYCLAFMQAIISHHFPTTHFTAGFAVLLAALLWRLSWNRKRLAVGLAVFFVLGSVADCVRKDVTRNGHFGELAKIGEFLPPDAVLGITDLNPVSAYYAHRPHIRALERVEDVEDFRTKVSAQFPERPLYYMLGSTAVFPYEPLRKHLDEHYPMVFEVKGFFPTRVYALSPPPSP